MVEKRGGNDLSWRLSVKAGDLVKFKHTGRFATIVEDPSGETGMCVLYVYGSPRDKNPTKVTLSWLKTQVEIINEAG